MRLAGLTGGIACGKSTVTRMLREEQITVIDSDAIAQETTQKGRWGYRRVVKAFGPGILTPDGEIDRSCLADIVFHDSAARRRLNTATHLPIAMLLAQRVAWAWLCCVPTLVVDMPLLFETGAYKVTRPRVLVACDAETQLQRLMARDATDVVAARARMEAQMPLEAKRKLADVVIDNSGSLADTRKQVVRLAKRLKNGGIWQHMTSPVAVGIVCLCLATIFAHL